MGFFMKRNANGCHEVYYLELGAYMTDACVASNILDLFEEAKGTLDAHGMGTSCGMPPYQLFSNYKV
jgi:hypothetical protein